MAMATPGSGGYQSRPCRRGADLGQGNVAIRPVQSGAVAAGAARSADDWAPVVELPGAPQESPDGERAGGRRGSTPPPPARAPGAARSRHATRAP